MNKIENTSLPVFTTGNEKRVGSKSDTNKNRTPKKT
jgi:hypothetical protein